MTFLRNLVRDLDDTSRTALQILLILAGVGITTSAISTIIDSNSFWAWLDGFTQNFATEMIGAVITFVLFELLVNKRKHEQDRAQAIEKEKSDLIIQMRSKDNATAINAVERLRARGWLEDGNLVGTDLSQAHLQRVRLDGANLERSNLERSNLQDAYLREINLLGSFLRKTDLQGANLEFSNLQGANLEFSNLQGANLQGADISNVDLKFSNLKNTNLVRANLENSDLGEADIRGADLFGANLQTARLMEAALQGTNLNSAIFSNQTELPDSSRTNPKHWNPNVDMNRYTDPNHPNFWQPDWTKG